MSLRGKGVERQSKSAFPSPLPDVFHAVRGKFMPRLRCRDGEAYAGLLLLFSAGSA